MVNKLSFKSPLRYPGGKGCIFKFMSQFLKDNNMVGIDYAEPYAGGAGLALMLMMDEYVGDIFINDLDPSIYAFWYILLNRPDSLCEWIESVPVTVERWKYYKQVQTEYKTVDLFELAKSTFFLNRTNVSGVLSGGVIGGINQTGKFKIDARFNKAELISRIRNIHFFSHRIHLSNYDGIDFVKGLEKRKNELLVYLDPPYYKKGSDLYMNAFSEDDHRQLSTFVLTMRNKWIISYDNQEFIKHLYEKEYKVLYQLSQCASNRVGDEILILDKRLHLNDSLHYLNNAVVI